MQRLGIVVVVALGCGSGPGSMLDDSSSSGGANSVGAEAGFGSEPTGATGSVGSAASGPSGGTSTASSGEGDSTTTGTVGSEGGTDNATTIGVPSDDGSRRFVQNPDAAWDYGRQLSLPPGFGAGEFTLELAVRADDSWPVGPTSGEAEKLTNWSDADPAPYSSGTWWYDGNFLLDGHLNAGARGTFSIQIYGGGRVRWLFADGGNLPMGGYFSVQGADTASAPSILDDAWHFLAFVRRWRGAGGSRLELWIDGELIAEEESDARTDMTMYWDTWEGYLDGHEGWVWGAEKFAVEGGVWEDYKGLVAQLRFWDRARTMEELTDAWQDAVVPDAEGLVGHYPMGDETLDIVCDVLEPTRCIDLVDVERDDEGPPLQ